MQRCPACNARLSAGEICPRCGADLGRVFRCERLAEQWLSVALQSLRAGRADVAVSALLRSLSLKQTPAANLVKSFLIEHQYRALYENLAQRHWQKAADIVSGLRKLQGQNEALRRFDQLIGHLSALSDSVASHGEIVA